MCLGFEEFISSTTLGRVKNGALLVWGKVGSVRPPHLVMPITVEPTKPRMCQDERFLNLWIKDLPLSLDYIPGLPRYVVKSHYQTTFDDKSGYDHVRLSPDSSTLAGGPRVKRLVFLLRLYPLGGRPAPTFIIRFIWLLRVTSALLGSRAVNILMIGMLANSPYFTIFSIPSISPQLPTCWGRCFCGVFSFGFPGLFHWPFEIFCCSSDESKIFGFSVRLRSSGVSYPRK